MIVSISFVVENHILVKLWTLDQFVDYKNDES